MKLDAQVLASLRLNLAAVALCLAAGSSITYFSIGQYSKAKSAQKAANGLRAEAQGKLARVSDEERELRDKIVRFRTLEARGLVGQEHRLDWIERIRAIKNERRLLNLQYELAPQQPMPGQGVASDFQLMVSTMVLRIDLIHEEDLLSFLGDLKTGVQAMIRVRSCSMERIPRAGQESASGAQLKSLCELEWITLRAVR